MIITGAFSVPQVIEESICRTSEDYELSEVGDYKIHSTALMPNIEFEEAKEEPFEIDDSIFINDDDTKLTFEKTIECQNYLTTRYVGRAPLEFYGPKTKHGREFILICRNGDPAYQYRYFGTESAVRGFNRNANENVIYKK